MAERKDEEAQSPISPSSGNTESSSRSIWEAEKAGEGYLIAEHIWFASVVFPLVAGAFGPMTSAFNICALTQSWRVVDLTKESDDMLVGRSVKNPEWSVFFLPESRSLSRNTRECRQWLTRYNLQAYCAQRGISRSLRHSKHIITTVHGQQTSIHHIAAHDHIDILHVKYTLRHQHFYNFTHASVICGWSKPFRALLLRMYFRRTSAPALHFTYNHFIIR